MVHDSGERKPFDTVYSAIRKASGEELELYAWAVVNRYEELYPDHEVGLLSLPINDPNGRKRCIEGLFEYPEKQKLDSLC